VSLAINYKITQDLMHIAIYGHTSLGNHKRFDSKSFIWYLQDLSQCGATAANGEYMRCLCHILSLLEEEFNNK
jgi:hypothetical protein